MDFKNFIDILTAPKNIGSNKWVLNNFSDLKSSNDYLHIIRLRYDNRWLRIYWDGKLKEVEKDNNFYISTPIKNKVFSTPKIVGSNLNLLDLNYKDINFNLPNKSNIIDSDLSNIFLKKIKGQLDEGSIKNNLYTNDSINFYIAPENTHNVDNIFTEYRFIKSFYGKNTSKSLTNFDEPVDL